MIEIEADTVVTSPNPRIVRPTNLGTGPERINATTSNQRAVPRRLSLPGRRAAMANLLSRGEVRVQVSYADPISGAAALVWVLRTACLVSPA